MILLVIPLTPLVNPVIPPVNPTIPLVNPMLLSPQQGPRGDALGQQPDKIMAAPWAVALLLRLPVGYVFICGGALIHPQAVLTAARCVAK